MKYSRWSGVFVLLAIAGADAAGAVRWNMAALSEAPRVWADPNRSVEGVQAIFYEGLPWKGQPTRVFAYYGLPEVSEGQKVPAMVLVHGGGARRSFRGSGCGSSGGTPR